MRVLLVGDSMGVAMSLRHVPHAFVCGIVGACNRPQYHEHLCAMAKKLDVPFLVQPLHTDPYYTSFMNAIRETRPRLLLCNSYSLLIRDDFLSVSETAVNLHGGKLPEYRGANPIQWSLINGERTVGITLHAISATLDGGDVVGAESVNVSLLDTWRDVQRKLNKKGDALLERYVPRLLAGTEKRKRQCSNQRPFHSTLEI